jgi:putative solute:sodium symporter small subunit
MEGLPMVNNRKRRRRTLAVSAQHPELVAMLRRVVTLLLPAWLAYFLAITLWAKKLNAITIPYVDVPLGAWLVIQGAVLAFAIMLIVLARAATARA